MNEKQLLKLNLDELEAELAKGEYSAKILASLLKAEKSDKSPRKGALELIEGAIAALGDTDLPKITESTANATSSDYAVAEGQSIGFRAGIKTAGDVVDVNWPEFKSNDKLLASMLERGLVVKQ